MVRLCLRHVASTITSPLPASVRWHGFCPEHHRLWRYHRRGRAGVGQRHVHFPLSAVTIESLRQYYLNGVPFNKNQSISGQLNGSGAFSVSVPSNTSITPSGSTWAITVASAATSPGYTTSLTITGASQSISASVIPPAIAINLAVSPGSFTTAYTDAEIVAAVVGSSYYNLTGQIQHYCQVVSGPACITWSTGGGSGSGNASISGSNCEPAYLHHDGFAHPAPIISTVSATPRAPTRWRTTCSVTLRQSR